MIIEGGVRRQNREITRYDVQAVFSALKLIDEDLHLRERHNFYLVTRKDSDNIDRPFEELIHLDWKSDTEMYYFLMRVWLRLYKRRVISI